MKVFLDTNILLDVLSRREPHCVHSALVWSRVERGTHAGYISAISFNNVHYIIQRAGGRRTANKAVRLLRDMFSAVPLDEQIIDQVMDSDFADFEDAIQFFSALRTGADCIISRDIAGFAGATIPVVTPEEFLAGKPG